MRNHTGTHLLHRALRNVVGERARQAGSLVTPDYLRFDFPFDRALTDDEKRAIEDEVRAVIRDDRPVTIAFMTMAEAIEQGADAFFDEKYGETVRTIRVEDYSFELCGGTHCRATGQIGGFVITGERSIGSGMRRIEALTGAARGPPRSRAVARRSSASPTAVGAPDDRRRRGPDRRAPGRAARGEAAPQGRARRRPAPSRPSSPPRPRRSRRASRSSSRRVPYESIDALKAAAKDVRGALAVGRHRAGARRRRAAAVRDRLRRPRRRGRRRPATSSGPRCRALDGKGGGRPEMAQGKGTAAGARRPRAGAPHRPAHRRAARRLGRIRPER